MAIEVSILVATVATIITPYRDIEKVVAEITEGMV